MKDKLRKHLVGLAVGVLTLLVTLTLMGPARESAVAAEDDPVVYRALIMVGNEAYLDDATEFVSALKTPRFGDPAAAWWSSARALNILGGTWAQVRQEIKDTFKEADSNDVSLIVISTSGTKVNDGADKDDKNTGDKKLGECTTLPCDEALTTIGGVGHGDGEFSRDDSLDDLFTPFQVGNDTRFNGPKIIVLSACYCGGLADGTRDLPVANSVVLMASGTNELSRGQSPAFQNDQNEGHMWFLGYLIAGLADDGSGKARASGGDNTVTVDEWFEYAKGKVEAAEPRQHPQKNFSKGSGDWVILKYNDATLIQHSEKKFTGNASEKKQQCDCDEESCPTDGPVGGITELPDIAPDLSSRTADDSGPSGSVYAAIAVGVAAAAVALGSAAWYTRRRCL